MSSISDPRQALISFQEALNSGMPVNKIDADLVERCDEIPSGVRFAYAKISNGEVQALVTFGPDELLNGIECYSVNYVVSERHQGQGLAALIVNRGLEQLINRLRSTPLQRFYLEAIIEESNLRSVRVAEKLFPESGQKIIEKFSNQPALHFKRVISLR